MSKLRNVLFAVLASASLLLASESVRSATYTYQSNGHEIFEIVTRGPNQTRDKAGDKKESRAPGIYKIDRRTGEDSPLILGNVNWASRGYKGILSDVDGFSHSGTQAVLTVVDGRLVFLNFNSNPKNPKSSLTFGGQGPGHIGVVDILSGTQVQVPKIEEMDDLHLFKADELVVRDNLPKGGVVFLASIRAPSVLGTGLTFAFVAEESEGKDLPSVLNRKAFLLSFDFSSTETLKRLASGSVYDGNLYSPLVINNSRLALKGDESSKTLKSWDSQLARFLQYLNIGFSGELKGRDLAQISVGVPHFNILRQTLVNDELPIEVLGTNGKGRKEEFLAQAYDPVAKRYSLIDLGKAPDSYETVTIDKHDLKMLTRVAVDKATFALDKIDREPNTGKYELIGVHFPSFDSSDTKQIEAIDQAFFYFSSGHLRMAIALENGIKGYHSFDTGIAEASPADSFRIIGLLGVADTGRTFRPFLVQRKSPRAQNSEIYLLVVEETTSARIVKNEIIYKGVPLSVSEMVARTVPNGRDPLFDNVSIARGINAYLKEKRKSPGVGQVASADEKGEEKGEGIAQVEKTVPYARLFSGLRLVETDSASDQKYLRPLVERDLVPGQVVFREFDPKGARSLTTGFYAIGNTRGTASSILGYPLFSERKRSSGETTHVSDAYQFQLPAGALGSVPAVGVTLFPYGALSKSSERNLSPKQFRLGLAFTAQWSISDADNVILASVDLSYPYKSLAFTKIVQGTKASAEDMHILLFFREDPNIPDSRNSIVTLNCRISRADLVQRRLKVEIQPPTPLARGLVSAADYKNHLKVDSDGFLHWDEDPNLAPDSSKKRFKKIVDPTAQIQARSASGLALRDPDHITDMGVRFANRNFRSGGLWEIFGRESLRGRVTGISDAIDELSNEDRGIGWSSKYKKASDEQTGDSKKSEKVDKTSGSGRGSEGNDKSNSEKVIGKDGAEKALLKRFEDYLEALMTAPKEEQRRIQVFLVEPALREQFRRAFFQSLARLDRTKHFSLRNDKMRFFYAEPNLDDVEISDELRHIEEAGRSKNPILYVEPDFLLNNQISTRTLDVDDSHSDADYDYEFGLASAEKEDLKSVFPHDRPEAKASFNVLLASGGRAKSIKGWRRVMSTAPTIPTIVIATPNEWRNILSSQNNQQEVENGVFDRFEPKFDYLTSSWSMWPPSTDRASEDIKALGRTVYNSDEMKVFPTLDQVLQAAARGELRGRQQVIIVPPELKPIVLKLMMLRWATSDFAAAGAWSSSNGKLALFRLGLKDFSQHMIQDNFKAIQGAAAGRNSVLIGDLEVVERMARPSSPGRNFTIKDPISAKKDLLDATVEAAMPNLAVGAWPFNPPVEAAPAVEKADSEGEAESSEQSEIGDELATLTENLDTLNENIQTTSRDLADLRESFSRGTISKTDFENQKSTLDGYYKDLIRQRDETSEKLGKFDGRESGNTRQIAPGRFLPHMLYWLAAEGRSIQPKRQKGWNLKSAIDRKASTILVGTQEEWNRLVAATEPEAKFFDPATHFELLHLTPPDEATRTRLVQGLFDRPEIASIGLRFSLQNADGRDPKMQLIHHFCNRVEHIAYDAKIEKTTAFVKAFTALKHALSEDLELRRSRLMDELFIERLFTKVFPMQLNPRILSPNDPLQRLANVDQAIRGLQKEGYSGSNDLKRQVIENYLAQTRPTDSSRPIPNSQIFFGKTSKGKTFLIQCLIRWLGLIEYNPNRPSNADADYIFISVPNLTDDQSVDPEKIQVDRMIENVLDLLSQPKGARATIVLDDFHKASSKVRVKLFQFIQGFFEAKNGMINVRSKDGRRMREIPVQNLNFYMTVNPQTSERARSEYIQRGVYYAPADLLKREVLAAIAGDGWQPEESVLARWADIVNIDLFPRSAKVPELGKRVRKQGRTSTQSILVEPRVIDALVGEFEQANARELFAPAAAALTTIPLTAVPSKLYVVSLRENVDLDHAKERLRKEQVNLQELSAAVRQLTQVDPVQFENPASMLNFMALIMQGFRMQIFNNILLEAHMSDQLKLRKAGAANLLKTSFLMALSSHVLDNVDIPKHEMVIRPEELTFLSRSGTREFYDHLKEIRTSTRYFPERFGIPDGGDFDLHKFIEGRATVGVSPPSRKSVIADYAVKVEEELRKALSIYLRLKGPDSIRDLGRWKDPEVRAWFGDLPEENPEKQVRDAMERILELYLSFQADFSSPSLVDFKEESVISTSIYTDVRIFGYIIDRALTRLPWGHVAKFMVEFTDLASDLSLGTKTSYKEYVGTHEFSPFEITTPEFMSEIEGIAKTMRAGSQVGGSGEAEIDRGASSETRKIHSVCESILSVGSSKRGQ